MTLFRRLGALFLLLLTSPCLAQGVSNPGGVPLDPQTYGRRTDAFRRLLFELNFQPLLRFEDLQANPSESLFIMLGDPRCLSRRNLPNGLSSFVKQGGAVLIATDEETVGEAGKELSDLAGVVVTGEKLYCGDYTYNYGNSAWCPLLEPSADDSPFSGLMKRIDPLAAAFGARGRPELFRNLHSGDPTLRVATNTPSRLQKRASIWWPFAGLPSLARLSAGWLPNGPEPIILPKQDLLFAVGGTVGQGRVLVLADHSIFINRMMLPHDNGNMEFAANCLRWLRGDASSPLEIIGAAKRGNGLQQLIGQRRRVLFWEDYHVHNNFEVPLKKMPPVRPSEPAIVAAIDKTIARLEDEDIFNRELFASMDDLPGGRRQVYRYTVYLLTLAAAMLLAYRFVWRARHRAESAVPPLAEAVRGHEPKVSLLDQRRRALLRLGNLWEMGHRLARECFESAGVAVTGASPPRVEIAYGGWRKRWRWRSSVDRLWRLARSDAPIPLSPAALRYRLRELDELKTALANGTIRLT